MNKAKKKISPALAGLLIIFSVMAIATVPAFAAQSAYANRDIETQTLAPGDSTTVTVTITNNVSQSLSLDEDIPVGWTLTRGTDDAATFNPTTHEWVWFSVAAGATKTVTYSLTVASDATAGDYTISGTISNASGVIDTVKGEETIAVALDATPPAIDFVAPTPANGSTVTVNYVNVTVNVTDPSGVSIVVLKWNGVLEMMHASGYNTWSVNKTNLPDGDYTYRVYANDTYNNWGVSEERVVTVQALTDILDYYRCLEGDCDAVSTMELLAAASDWSKGIAPPGFTEPITTMQLMQLASEWASK